VFDEPGRPDELTHCLFLIAPLWMFPGTVERVSSGLRAFSAFDGCQSHRLHATILGPRRYVDTDAEEVLGCIEDCGDLCEAGAGAVPATVFLESDIPLDIVCDRERLDGRTEHRLVPVLHRLGGCSPCVLVSAYGDFESSWRARHQGYSIVITRPAPPGDSSSMMIFSTMSRSGAADQGRASA